MTNPLDQLSADLADLDRQALRRRLPGPLPPNTVDFCSNDYLGLAAAPELAQAATAALDAGAGARAARLVAGDLPLHHQLEDRLARFKSTPAALLFSSGYQANVGTLAALLGPDDAVYSDALNHASIVDGCRLSRAKVHRYRHLDTDDLARQLAAGNRYRRRLIVTDSVFGMDGDTAPLQRIAALAGRYDAISMVDEAHATGVRGPFGRGLVAEQRASVDVQIATFGKALGCFGAAVLGSRPLIDYLVNRCRTFIFTTALPPAVCAATLAAVDIVDSPAGEARRARLHRNADLLHRGLSTLGLAQKHTVLRDPEPVGPIQPVILGSPDRAIAASRRLLDRGHFVQAIRPPTVPDGTSRLRLAVTASHTQDQIDQLLAALKQVLPPPQPNTRHPDRENRPCR